MDTTLESRSFSLIDGMVLRGDVFGDIGPRLILLPGGGQSRSAWRHTAAMLAEVGFHVLTLDLRGQGDSDWAPDGDYSFEAYAADLDQVLVQFGRAALVGSSLGGLAALAATQRAAGKVTALVLADVTPFQSGVGGRHIRALMQATAIGFADVDEAGRAIAAIMSTPVRAHNEGLREHLRMRDGRLFWNWDCRVIEDRFVDTPAVIDRLEDAARMLGVPTLLIHAECSDVVSTADVARFASLVPDLVQQTLPGARHMVTGDSNHAYGAMIAAFLNDVVRPI